MDGAEYQDLAVGVVFLDLVDIQVLVDLVVIVVFREIRQGQGIQDILELVCLDILV